MRLNQKEIRIQKLADKGMTAAEIAEKIGWGKSDDALAKVRAVLIKPHYLHKL